MDDLVADGIVNDLAQRMQAQLVHDVGAVGLDGLDGDIQRGSHFLVGLSFRQKLDDFPFSRGQTTLTPVGAPFVAIILEVGFLESVRHSGGECRHVAG